MQRSCTVRGASALALLAVICIVRADDLASEYKLKAAYLYNFARFVDWTPAPPAEFVIGVVGRDPFGSMLEETMGGKTVGGRPVVIRRLRSLKGMAECNVLFVSSSESKRWPEIFDALRNTRVLTVGETPGFASSGGMIGFTLERDKLRFEVNVAAADRGGVKISSNLLRLGAVVGR